MTGNKNNHFESKFYECADDGCVVQAVFDRVAEPVWDNTVYTDVEYRVWLMLFRATSSIRNYTHGRILRQNGLSMWNHDAT